MKIVIILGARFQVINAESVSCEIAKHSKKVKEVIVHTRQNYDTNMSDIFLLIELVEVGENKEKILNVYCQIFKSFYMQISLDLYGDSKASQKLLQSY